MISAIYNAAMQFSLGLLLFGSISHSVTTIAGGVNGTCYRTLLRWSRQIFMLAVLLGALLLTLKGIYIVGEFLLTEVEVVPPPIGL
ncbi:MAG: hypothetical protein ACI33M_06465 [Lysinibacillus sp.]